MKVIKMQDFSASRAWDAMDIEQFEGSTSVRLHWTDRPYQWHVNDGPEIFVVLDGDVEMKTRINGIEESHHLRPGMIFHAGIGDEHVAHPIGVARILVIEQTGSI